jgi:isoquinoline 1-oxidoreductase subunit beta
MSKSILEKNLTLSRRDFIVGSVAVAGGGLALGMNVPFGADAALADDAANEVNVWVAIKPDDTCVRARARALRSSSPKSSNAIGAR